MTTCDVALIQNSLGIQQTGPRTVIVPADPIIWEDDKSYEYLTLVASTDFGQGYVSKKDVPAGTPLTDTDYWIPVAQYNAQLAQIQRNIADMQQSIDYIDSLPQYKKGNTLVIIGDSWCRSGYDWTSNKGVIGMTLANALGIPNVVNASVNGNGYVGNTGTFLNQLNGLTVEEEDIALFIVFGSINDVGADGPKTGLNQAITSFSDTLASKYPNTVAHCFVIDSSFTYTEAMARTVNSMLAQMNQRKNMCAHLCNYFSNRYGNSVDAYWTADRIHPTTLGLQYFTYYMMRELLGGNTQRVITGDFNGWHYVALIDSQQQYVKIRVSADNATLGAQGNAGQIDTHLVPSDDSLIKMGEVTDTPSGKNIKFEYNQDTGGIIYTVIGYASDITFTGEFSYEFRCER